MFESILSYLWEALSATLIQILILLGPGKDRLLEGENARSVFPFLIVVITDKDKETSFAQGPRKESTIKST